MQTRRQFLVLAAGAGGLTGLGLWGASRGAGKLLTAQRTSKALGTEVSMTALHERQETAERALDAAFGELERVEEIMSIYRPQSQLCRLNRAGFLDDPDPYLLTVLRRAQAMSEQSGGAFDITVQPLWELYAAAKKTGRLPTASEIDAARRLVDWRKLEISSARVRIGSGMSATLNGIAQGFAADRALAALRAHGVEHALVNTGELGSLGSRADGNAWTAGIQHPRRPDAYVELARLDGRCMATSGDYATTFSEDRAYNHIFDPETGRSPEHFSSVTIVTPTGLDADALSTAIFVLGAEKGVRVIESTPGCDAFFVLKNGRTLATNGFPRIA